MQTKRHAELSKRAKQVRLDDVPANRQQECAMIETARSTSSNCADKLSAFDRPATV